MTEPTIEEIQQSNISQLSHWIQFLTDKKSDKYKRIVRRFYSLGGWTTLQNIKNDKGS